MYFYGTDTFLFSEFFSIELLCNIINVFTVILDQLNSFLDHESIIFL